MAQFDFTIRYKLELIASISASGKDEESALEKLEEKLLDNAGHISWTIEGAKGKFKGLELEEEDNSVELEY